MGNMKGKIPQGDALRWSDINPQTPTLIGKVFSVDKAGKLVTAQNPELLRSVITVRQSDDLAGFAAYLNAQPPGKATTYHLPEDAVLDEDGSVRAVTKGAWGDMSPDRRARCITRSGQHLAFRGGPGIWMIDHDPAPGAAPMSEEDLLAALEATLPAISKVSVVVGVSSTSDIYHAETGVQLKGAGGRRIYIAVADAEDIPRAGAVLVKRLWLAGYGSIIISSCGSLLERSIIDRSVWDPARLDFTGGAICVAPLEQRRPPFAVIKGDNEVLDTRAAVLDLTASENAEFERLVAEARAAVADEAEAVRQVWVEKKLETDAVAGLQGDDRKNTAKVKAAVEALRASGHADRLLRVAETGDGGRLPLDAIIMLADGAEVTVRDILMNPTVYDRAPCFDPLEPDYDGGRVVGRIHTYGVPNIFSFAHGGRTFRLGSADEWEEMGKVRRDALNASFTDVIKKYGSDVMSGPMLSVARALYAAAGGGDKGAKAKLAEIEELACEARNKTGWTKATQSPDETQPDADEALPEAERRPIIVYDQRNDEHVAAAKIAQTIGTRQLMFNQSGVVVAIHDLPRKGGGSNEETSTLTAVPAKPGDFVRCCSKSARLKTPDRKGNLVPAALSGPLLQATQRSVEAFPPLDGIITSPVVDCDGTFLHGRKGYDPARRIIIDAPMIALEQWEDPAAALDYLLNDWLGEVDFKTPQDGLRALTLAMSMLARAKYMRDPGPPMYAFTAPEAMTGKSWAAKGLLMAGSGVTVSERPWPEKREELEKVLFSLVRENASHVFFDNVHRGWRVGAAVLDAFITSEVFAGRILGVSETLQGSATFPVVLSGNNLIIEGDTISRTIEIRMESKTDPANRFRKKPQFFADTRRDLGRIVGALVSILTANVGEPAQIVGRFPAWYAQVAWPLMVVSGELDLFDFWKESDTTGGLGDDEGFINLLLRMHKVAMREGYFNSVDAETDAGIAWLTATDMLTHCGSAMREMSPGGIVPSVRGVEGIMRKYRDVPAGNLRFRIEERRLGDRTRRKMRRVFGIELRDPTEGHGIEAPEHMPDIDARLSATWATITHPRKERDD